MRFFPLVLYLYFMLFPSPFRTYLCISTNILTFTFLYLFLHIVLEFLFSQHSKYAHSPMYVALISASSTHIFSCQYLQLHIQTHTYLPLGKNFLILILLFLLLKLSLLTLLALLTLLTNSPWISVCYFFILNSYAFLWLHLHLQPS